MTDREFAAELVARLNKIIEDPAARKLIQHMIRRRLPQHGLAEHPTIQVADDGVGLLGLLNGLTGVIPVGPEKGWGWIYARLERKRLVRFDLREEPEDADE